MKMTQKAKKIWLKEVAKWLRKLSAAPAMLFLIVWSGNIALTMMGQPAALMTLEDLPKANVPSVLLAGVLYVVFNALATALEIKADKIADDPVSRIILPHGQCWEKRRGPGGNSS